MVKFEFMEPITAGIPTHIHLGDVVCIREIFYTVTSIDSGFISKGGKYWAGYIFEAEKIIDKNYFDRLEKRELSYLPLKPNYVREVEWRWRWRR